MENYDYILEELKAILVEGVYNSNLTLVETYHHLGCVLAEHDTKYGDKFTERVAHDLGKTPRTIQKIIRFGREYPDLQALLDQHDKALTWRKIANNILVDPKEKIAVEPEIELVPDIEQSILQNLAFLVETARITKDGLVFVLPKDMFIK